MASEEDYTSIDHEAEGPDDEDLITYSYEAERARAIQDAINRHPANTFFLDGGDVGDEKVNIEYHEPRCDRMNNPTTVSRESWRRASNAVIGFTASD